MAGPAVDCHAELGLPLSADGDMPGPGGGAVTRPPGGVVFVVIEAAAQHCFPLIEQAGAACSQAMLQNACTFPFTWW